MRKKHQHIAFQFPHALVAADVAAADTYWHKLLASSKGGFVNGTVVVQGYAPHAVLNATAVMQWIAAAGVGWPNEFLNASPQHYLALTGPGVRQPGDTAEVIERWGSDLITYFRAVPGPKRSFMPALDEFPLESQLTLDLFLSDGTVFSPSLTAFRDLPGRKGVEIYVGVWIPDSSPDDVVEDLRAHNTVEYSNWLKSTYKKAIAAL
ncbi:hypothetical protein F5B17DRAFT_434167 [Nemania serpens]|nr:hypothetical protein F5B17DRAFT_434167 [Nemania serpens]